MFICELKMNREIQRQLLQKFGQIAPCWYGVNKMVKKLQTECTTADLRKGPAQGDSAQPCHDCLGEAKAGARSKQGFRAAQPVCSEACCSRHKDDLKQDHKEGSWHDTLHYPESPQGD